MRSLGRLSLASCIFLLALWKASDREKNYLVNNTYSIQADFPLNLAFKLIFKSPDLELHGVPNN